ncbi:hypothetical protein HDZ31DRAFT_65451 [Schizophyllum fasciatum]
MPAKPDTPPVLDPGISRRRRTGSPCACLCWTIAGLIIAGVAALGVYLGYLALSKAASFVDWQRHPYKDLHYNGTVAGEAVRPLIDAEQTFDVVLSVWLRAPEAEEAAFLAENSADSEGERRPLSAPLDNMADLSSWMMGNPVHQMLRKSQTAQVLERPLFSDVIFKDARLSDRDRAMAIPLRIPTARFAAENLTNTDLRASFMIIPSSSVDEITNYSSWKPDAVVRARPARAWPFPLDSEHSGEKTLADRALESFSVISPMVRFHEVKNRCGPDGTTGIGSANVHDDSDHNTDNGVAPHAEDRKYAATPHKTHPHIVTRAELRIVDSAPTYQRKAFMDKHASLVNDPCSMVRLSFQPAWPFCDRRFPNNGHFEAYVESRDTEATDEKATQWAYAPYLDIRNDIAGPKDVVPVPVNRQPCKSALSEDDATSENDTAQYMDISLHVDFAGETPGRAAFASYMKWQSPPHTNESEYVQVMAHDNAELWNSVRGHISREDARPRLRVALAILSGVSYVAVFLFDAAYWYKCTSTVTISIHATELLMAAQLVSYIDSVVDDVRDEPENWWIHILMYLPELVLPFLMARAVYRLELGWRSGKGLKRWITPVKKLPASHRERASARTDERMMGDKLMLGVLVGSLFLSLVLRDTAFLPALHPTPDEANAPDWSTFKVIFGHAMNAFFWTGHLRQSMLRNSVRKFAGQYRLGALFICLATWADFVGHLTIVVGHYDARPAYHYVQLPGLGLTAWAAYQALTLRPERADEADEDEE